MIVMPGHHTSVKLGYLAGRFPGQLGLLISPGCQRGPFEFLPYALDNGVYAKGERWEERPFFKLLDWAKLSGQNPRWVIVPDVVGDRERTLERWEIYHARVRAYGFRLAFAVQDGMVASDVPKDADVIFVGGSTRWKWNTAWRWCGEFKRVHVGRVNTYRRLRQCHDLGAESCDGSGWFRGDHGSGKPWRAMIAYFEESRGIRQTAIQRSFYDEEFSDVSGSGHLES